MRCGNDRAQQNSVPRGSFGTHQIGGDDGFSVARFQRVQPSQTDGNECRGKQKPGAQMLGRDQFGKSAAWRLLLIGLEMHEGRRRRCRLRRFK
jgi:hypothetical protein